MARLTETISANPIGTEKSVRGDEIRALTSCRAGKIVPIAYIPLLREDRVSRGAVRVSFDMAETIHPLMNAVNVTLFAHFVPFSAFERFRGMDEFNRSYQGVEDAPGQTIPFFKTVNFDRAAPFWKTLGVHWKQGQPINDAVLEAYNTLVNFRRQARSAKLPLRGLLDTSLAPAFWKNPNMAHIVPDFDQAMMDGEVELQFASPKMHIQGIATGSATVVASNGFYERSPTGEPRQVNYPSSKQTYTAGHAVAVRTNTQGIPEVWAELNQAGIKLSLANIELAKKTAAFAKLREQYSGLDDDHIIDLLLEGIRVPDEANRQPQLLDRKSTIFGYSERHAMDGENLDKSVTTGKTEMALTFRTPPMNTGGIILITAEIVPEQLYERMWDTFLGTSDTSKLPNFLRDYLDPEKVEAVPNKFVDVEHATPNGTFGYAPLNHGWKRSITRIGGKYYRPNPDTFIEDRQRFWSVEQLNPTLTADFYMVGNLPHSVFADTLADPFEILALGRAEIVGNTVFGRTLTEDEGHYEAVADQVDDTRIVLS